MDFFSFSLDAFGFTVMNKFCVQKYYFRHKTGWATEWEEEKPSKVQKVLHYSITALTFLAFAGYLLCMIVQAIKSKGKLNTREKQNECPNVKSTIRLSAGNRNFHNSTIFIFSHKFISLC